MPRPRMSTEKFVEKSRSIHGDKYDYSKVEYTVAKKNVKIICPVHGEFLQIAGNHINGQNCPKCAEISRHNTKRKSLKDFIKYASKIHNNFYNYSKFEYGKNGNIKGIIICPEHGEFSQTAFSHSQGHGCRQCFLEKNRNIKTKEFFEVSKKIHNDTYDYSNVKYIKNSEKVKIICPIHGEFMQTPSSHKVGKGCPTCNESKGELKIRKFLINNNIEFEPQYTFKGCRHKQVLPFDFYIESENLLIEYDGIQHYKPIKNWGGKDVFLDTKMRDDIKTQFAIDNNITLIRIPYVKFNNIESVLEALF